MKNKIFAKKAKEIIGKWGYEEKSWWKPIAEALMEQDKISREDEKQNFKS